MSQTLLRLSVVAVALTSLPSLAAAVVVEPLLVVVETAPGAAVDAIEVRQVITGELGTRVRAPRDPAGPDTSDLLIVAVDRAEIRMSLRARATGVVSRAVPAPGDRKGRLQSIGWLAGNLAREQVGAIVAQVPAPPDPVLLASAEVAPASHAEVPPPAPTTRPATDPPPFAQPAARETAGASGVVVSTQASPAAAGLAWSLTLAGGPSASFQQNREAGPAKPVWPRPGVYSLELQRRASPDGLIIGAALDVAPSTPWGGPGFDFVGAAALVGRGHRFKRTFVEATAGLGLEAHQGMVYSQSTSTSSTGVVTSDSDSYTTLGLGLYLRGQATAGLALSKSFDLLASVGGHLGTGRGAFMTSSLGVRFRFQ